MDLVMDNQITITKFTKRRKVYDGEKLWKIYHSWGRAATHRKLREWAIANGMFNPKSRSGGPSQMGPYFSMWRWALNNPEKAYPAYEKWAKEYEDELIAEGIGINFQNFLKDIQEHARSNQVVGHERYLEFCEKYELEP